jgi:hypothetical protein
MPIPLAMMIPFMATQSLIMGEAFGKSYQYGKRKISAMSNEEFNKLTIEQMTQDMFNSYKLIIPSLKESINDSQALQNHIIGKILSIPSEMIAGTFANLIDPNSDPNKFQPKSGEPAYDSTPSTATNSPGTSRRTPATGQESSDAVAIKQLDLKLKRIWTGKSFPDQGQDARLQWRRVKGSQQILPDTQLVQWYYDNYMKQQVEPMIKQLSQKRTAFKNKYGYWV